MSISSHSMPHFVNFGLTDIRIFKRHGAANIRSPWIDADVSDMWHSMNEIGDGAEILLGGGTVLTLPYDLRLGFAKLLASLARDGASHSSLD